MKAEKIYNVVLTYLEEGENENDVLITKVIGKITEEEYSQRMYGNEYMLNDLDPDSTINYELIKQK